MSTSYYQGIHRLLIMMSVLLLAFVFEGCNRCENIKVTNEDTGVTINDPIKAPAAFAFIDANVVSNSYVPNVRVTLIDPNGQVRTSSGTSFSELTLKNGVMNLGLHYRAAVNEEKPYRYRIKAEAPGYITTMKTILLINENATYMPVYMAKIAGPPKGINTVNTSLPVNGNGYVTDRINFETKVSDSFTQKLSFSIPAGTQLLSNCKPISNPDGEAQIQLAFSNPSAPNAGRTFPNGFLVTDAIDMKGDTIATPSNPGLFASAGWMSASIQVGQEEVTDFSKPVEATIGINPEMINPVSQERFTKGDTLPIWSLDENTGYWRLEEEAIVENIDEELVVTFPMNHLSTWNLDYWMDKCPADINFEVDNQGCTRLLNVEISNYNNSAQIFTPTGVSGTSEGISDFPLGLSSHTITQAPQNIPLKIKIFDYDSPPNFLVESEDPILCNGTPINPIEIPSTGPTIYTNIEVILNFHGGGQDKLICNNSIWYREYTTWGSSAPYSNAGVLKNGKLTTHEIEAGIYEFLIWYDDPNNGTNQNYIRFKNDFGSPFGVDAGPNTTSTLTQSPTDGNTSGGSMLKICSRDRIGLDNFDVTPPSCNACNSSSTEMTVRITLNDVTINEFDSCLTL